MWFHFQLVRTNLWSNRITSTWLINIDTSFSQQHLSILFESILVRRNQAFIIAAYVLYFCWKFRNLHLEFEGLRIDWKVTRIAACYAQLQPMTFHAIQRCGYVYFAYVVNPIHKHSENYIVISIKYSKYCILSLMVTKHTEFSFYSRLLNSFK